MFCQIERSGQEGREQTEKGEEGEWGNTLFVWLGGEGDNEGQRF